MENNVRKEQNVLCILSNGRSRLKCFRLICRAKIKKLERENLVAPPVDEIKQVSFLNLTAVDNEAMLEKKEMVDLISTLKEQTRVMNIINKNANCPIAEIMRKL
ncbi:hypothetical protein RN001_009249 [Aquatica leii]|uniref:Uncharacterized protein n=1 Tax=Aquatica leii TaxID=1421715 RepID=A0AAN7P6D3_9COLE|nr:hypothetical protein RN001_009249 [Aquatica leii]